MPTAAPLASSPMRADLCWHHEAERLGGPEIDDQFDFRSPLHRQVPRLLAVEDASDIYACLVIRMGKVWTVAHQAACRYERAKLKDRGQPMTERQRAELVTAAIEK